ncbi:MAG: hypothetical protein J6K95_08775 [Rikenellaceae bacterium]|nr:hypothetical protein [Rikenellaceae bacterium]
MLDNWQRIEKLVRWTGLSVNSFALSVGLPRGENLYQIKKGNNGISKELANLITAKYPTVNKAWLLTGEGSTFLDSNHKMKLTPFYSLDIETLGGSRARHQITSMISLPMFEGSEFAALSLSAAMAPAIPQGAIVVVGSCDKDCFIPGNDYLVAGKKKTVLRTVRNGSREGTIRLIPANRTDFDEMEVELREIDHLYQVLAVITSK